MSGGMRETTVTYPMAEARSLPPLIAGAAIFGLPRQPKRACVVQTTGPCDLMTRLSRVRPVGSYSHITATGMPPLTDALKPFHPRGVCLIALP